MWEALIGGHDSFWLLWLAIDMSVYVGSFLQSLIKPEYVLGGYSKHIAICIVCLSFMHKFTVTRAVRVM